MIGTIRDFFDRFIQAPTPEPESASRRLQLATAALLMEMVRADFQTGADEQAEVESLLRRHFGLTDAEARELRALGDAEAHQATSLYEFTRLLDQHLDTREKEQVLELLWRVALADRYLDKYEEYLVRKVADLLHLSHSQFIRTKHRVAQTLGTPPGD